MGSGAPVEVASSGTVAKAHCAWRLLSLWATSSGRRPETTNGGSGARASSEGEPHGFHLIIMSFSSSTTRYKYGIPSGISERRQTPSADRAEQPFGESPRPCHAASTNWTFRGCSTSRPLRDTSLHRHPRLAWTHCLPQRKWHCDGWILHYSGKSTPVTSLNTITRL